MPTEWNCIWSSGMWQDQSPQLRKDVLTLLGLFYINIVSHRFWGIESWGNLWLMVMLSKVRRFDTYYYLYIYSIIIIYDLIIMIVVHNMVCKTEKKKKKGKPLQPAFQYKFASNIFSASSMFSFLRQCHWINTKLQTHSNTLLNDKCVHWRVIREAVSLCP